jgi:hypothetical protein
VCSVPVIAGNELCEYQWSGRPIPQLAIWNSRIQKHLTRAAGSVISNDCGSLARQKYHSAVNILTFWLLACLVACGLLLGPGVFFLLRTCTPQTCTTLTMMSKNRQLISRKPKNLNHYFQLQRRKRGGKRLFRSPPPPLGECVEETVWGTNRQKKNGLD